MSEFAIFNAREAQSALRSMNSFLSVTKRLEKGPEGEFKTQLKAESHVYARQYVRSKGGGHLDNAIMHLERGATGQWVDEMLAMLKTDRAAIGDGVQPKLIGATRAHIEDAARMLNGSVQEVHPGLGRAAKYGVGITAAILGVAYLVGNR